MSKSMYCLYALEPKSTVGMNLSKVRYIGIIYGEKQTLKARLSVHKSESRNGKSTHKCNWIRSLWDEGDDVVITKIKVCESIEELKEEEKIFISLVKRIHPDWKLTNKTDGGDGVAGYVYSAEQNKANSERCKKRFEDPLEIKKNSERGKKQFEDPEQRNKFAKPIVDNFGNVWVSLSEAARCLGLDPSSICGVLKGKYKQTGGFSFQYLQINA